MYRRGFRRRRVSTSASAALPPAGGGPLLCLERAVGERAGADAALWASRRFAAQVYPDLPVADTLLGLVQRGLAGGGGGGSSGSPPAAAGAGGGAHGLTVRTVAAQVRSMAALEALMAEQAQRADALLLLSGSHPARALPGAAALLPGALGLLRRAAEMRAAGALPPGTGLWAVENPLLTPPARRWGGGGGGRAAAPTDRLAAKLDAGAEVVLTQPPLLWGRAAAWFEAAAAAGLAGRCRLFVGAPIASSRGNLDFWLRLAGARGEPGAEAALASFPDRAQFGSAAGLAAAVRAWNADLVRRSLALPGVAGLHVMPLTPGARALAAELLADGTLPGGGGGGGGGGGAPGPPGRPAARPADCT